MRHILISLEDRTHEPVHSETNSILHPFIQFDLSIIITFPFCDIKKHMYMCLIFSKNDHGSLQNTFEKILYAINALMLNELLLFYTVIQTTTTANTELGPVTSTEKYRITRKELGYILGRNYRGLKKLWNIEINDALNVR